MYDEYVYLAMCAVEEYVCWNKTPLVRADCVICDEVHFKGFKLRKELLQNRFGVCVQLTKKNELRGYGITIKETKKTLAEEIIFNAICACAKDPRFNPVNKEELKELTYTVDIIGKLKTVTLQEELNPSKYGIMLSKGYRRSIVLPNIDKIKTVEQQIELACINGNISLSENPLIECFTTERHCLQI